MNFGQLLEPSFNSSSGAYISSLTKRPSLNPGKNASLLARVKALALRHLAAFPLLLTATLDLIVGTIFLIGHRNAKHYLINLVATLSLFPQAIGLLIFGKQPVVNYVRAFDSAACSISSAIEHGQNPRHQKLILSQLKRCDKASLAKALSATDLYGNTWLQVAIKGKLAWPELVDFLIEHTNLNSPPRHGGSYLQALIDAFDQQNRPQNFNENEHERLAQKLIEQGAPFSTRTTAEDSSRLFGKLNDLEAAVRSGWLAATEMLLKMDDDLPAKLNPLELTARNNKLLGLAVYYQKPTLIAFMLNKGADPMASINGKTVWSIALDRCHAETIQLLIQNGINPNLPNEDGFTAMDFSLFAFSSITEDNAAGIPVKKSYEISDTDTNTMSPRNQKNREQRLETAKMLLSNGAEFNPSYLDSKFKQAVAHMDEAQLEELQKMQRDNEALALDKNLYNPYLAKILRFATNPHSHLLPSFLMVMYSESLKHLQDHLEELKAAQAQGIQLRASQIDTDMTQIHLGFPQALTHVIAEFC